MDELKVANSGVITANQMDVYETTDLPEDEQNVGQIVFGDSSQNDCVEAIGVSVQQAFHHFHGKTLDANDADFSDDISRVRYSGYSANTLSSLDGDVGSETLDQRCQRLQQELRDLAKEVELMKQDTANLDPSSSSIVLSPLDLINQTEYLKRQMVDLTAETQMGVSNSVTLSDPQGALQRRLLAELNGFQKSDSVKSQATPKVTPSGDSDHVNYQLFYRPEQAKFCNNARIADFEQRIERLEAVLGQSPEKLSLLTSELSNKNLMSALCLLLAKAKVLDPGQLDLLEPRLSTVYHKVSRTAEKKEPDEQTKERLSKISALYESVRKWDSMANAVPHIVDRLTVLKDGQLQGPLKTGIDEGLKVCQLLDLVAKADNLSANLPTIVDRLSTLSQLHEQAVEVSETLVNLDLSQRQMNEHLSGDTAMLKQFHDVLLGSATITESNTRSLTDRLKAVADK